MSLVGKLWRRARNLFPVTGFYFDRPLVLLQSDDWGRIGVRDQDGWEQLRAAGIALGDHAYDFYSLETAEDVTALAATLRKHRDSVGGNPVVEMNFIVTNPDFAKMNTTETAPLQLLPLADGLPRGWKRPNLMEAYRAGIGDGVFRPALHGTTHFCRPAVECARRSADERAALLNTLWQAGTPYIYWRMPWIGYEYWDPAKTNDEQFLAAETQRALIGQAVGEFAKLFATLPRSACAPGYRANDDTHQIWAQHGIRTAQDGPGSSAPPYFDRYEVLHLTRTVEFEPAVDREFSVDKCLRQAEQAFARGVPAIVSVHSINFHSTLKDFCGRTLAALDEFLTALEAKHPDLLYLQDDDVESLVSKGNYGSAQGSARVNVMRKKFRKAAMQSGLDA